VFSLLLLFSEILYQVTHHFIELVVGAARTFLDHFADHFFPAVPIMAELDEGFGAVAVDTDLLDDLLIFTLRQRRLSAQDRRRQNRSFNDRAPPLTIRISPLT